MQTTRGKIGQLFTSVLAGLIVITTFAPTANALTLTGLVNDTLNRAPSLSGTYAYNSFVPANTAGASYTDPIFGSTVRRLTTDGNADDSYARNMWWNADGTKYAHRTKNGTPWPSFWNMIDSATGKVTHYGVPIGDDAMDSGFDPVDPNVFYKYVGNQIIKIVLNSNGTWTESVYFTAPSTIKSLGGTLNWLDASGRYMIVRYGTEPSVHVYDRINMAAGPYTGALSGAENIDLNGYLGLTPDGNYVVGYNSNDGFGYGEGVSYKIDHASRSVTTIPNRFWSLCGDHGTFMSASDGRNYMIVNNCTDSPEIWRVDITNNAAGPLPYSQQKSLPNNKKLLTFPNWSNGTHFSSVAKGALKDWVFISTEDGRDTFNSDLSFWQPYSQEIIAINALTGETRRLAHHRSRGTPVDYYNQPRLTASWGGEFVAWNSNFNKSGIIDVFALPFGAAASSSTPTTEPTPEPTPIPSPSTTDTTAPIISGITTSNLSANSITINWQTNEPADTQIEYCVKTTAHCGVLSQLVSEKVSSHKVVLTNLKRGTRYYFWVRSKDPAGNLTVSDRRTFLTKK